MNTGAITPDAIRAAIPRIDSTGQCLPGGQAMVFPCVISGQPYALKVIPLRDADLTRDGDATSDDSPDEVTARASREVEILSFCDSPYIVKLGPLPMASTVIAGQQVVYFTLEWIEGASLKDVLRSTGRLPLSSVVALGNQIGVAIREIWSFEKIHRDIKPGNIMRRGSTSEFVLLDMGVAFDLRSGSLTATQGLPGTWRYFSPEQFDYSKKRLMDFRSDLFALGVVMYEAVTGQHPFWIPNQTNSQVAQNIRHERPVSPRRMRPEISPQLEAIILRLLSKQAHMRFRRCDELIAALNSTPDGG